jgi:hypothetical protein
MRKEEKKSKPLRYLNQSIQMLPYISRERPAVLRLIFPSSEIVVAHVELVFAGLDEDEARAFCCRLPDL